MFSYDASSLIEHVLDHLVYKTLVKGTRKFTEITKTCSDQSLVAKVTSCVMQRMEDPNTTESESLCLVCPEDPAWATPSSLLALDALKTFKAGGEIGYTTFPELSQQDYGTESELSSWALEPLVQVCRFAAMCCCQEVVEKGLDGKVVAPEVLKKVFSGIAVMTPGGFGAGIDRAYPDWFTHDTFMVELKTWQTFNALHIPSVDDACLHSRALNQDAKWVQATSGQGKDNAKRCLGQVCEYLLSNPNCPEVLFTNIFGVLYRCTVTAPTKMGNGKYMGGVLHISQNLMDRHQALVAHDDSQRRDRELYRPLVKHLLDYSSKRFQVAVRRLVEQEQARAAGAVVEQTAGMDGEGRLSSSASWWLGSIIQSAVFTLTPAVHSGSLIPLPLEGWFRHWIPRCLSLHLDFSLVSAGKVSCVWVDRRVGVVFKLFGVAEDFEREVSCLRRLAGFLWVPKVLGTVVLGELQGVFMTVEGTSVSSADWAAVQGWVLLRIKDLHELGIHHHDIAPRNILRRPDSSLVLIDFANSVEAMECEEGDDCPDLYPDTDFD